MLKYCSHLIMQAYKRVGGQVHCADMGRGVIGVIDVTNLMVRLNMLLYSSKQHVLLFSADLKIDI